MLPLKYFEVVKVTNELLHEEPIQIPFAVIKIECELIN